MRTLLFLLLASLTALAADPAHYALPAPEAEATLPGEGALRQIVCGASNVAAGLKVPCPAKARCAATTAT